MARQRFPFHLGKISFKVGVDYLVSQLRIIDKPVRPVVGDDLFESNIKKSRVCRR